MKRGRKAKKLKVIDFGSPEPKYHIGDTVYWNWAFDFPVIIQYGKIVDIVDDDAFSPYKLYVMETGKKLSAMRYKLVFPSAEECIAYYHERKKVPKEFIQMADWAAR